MRIAFDYQIFALQTFGGVSRYFTRIAQNLLEERQQVEIFSPVYRNVYLSDLPREIVNGRYVARNPPKTARLLNAYNQCRSRFQIARWKPDVVHETYYSKYSSSPRASPTVITVYDMIHELFPNDFPEIDNNTAIKRIAIDRADHVICISENTKADLMRLYGTPPSKLSVVHLGFDRFIDRDNSQAFEAYSGKPFLLYVGQRGGYKNFAGLLRSVASSSQLLSNFDIVAFGGGGFSGDELALIHSLGYAANQVKQQSGNDNQLGRLYSSAVAFIYPSLYEGFGIPPLEAMAHHCPVISSNTSSMPEVIGTAGGYFDPADVDDMRRAIEDVVYSDDRVDELRRAGTERITKFSWNKCTRETLDIYRYLT
jgi:glycosyltransferase involved in cell wall biosynthesis